MPAEWEPHRGTWLSWPHKQASWPGKFGPVPRLFARMVAVLADHEEVHINVAGPALEAEVRRILADSGADTGNVFFHYHPTNDAWCRDHGPIFVQRANADGDQAIIDWGFNAWGGKYPPYDLDDVIPTRIAAELGLPVYQPGIVMEGGSLDVNGRGTLLTTEACLLNPNRNPALGRAEIEEYLRRYLGVTHILWLGEGIVGDDTDGHVDDLTRFVDERTVVTVVEDNPADENYEPLQHNLERLSRMTDQEGRPATPTSISPTAWCYFRPTILRGTKRQRPPCGSSFPAERLWVSTVPTWSGVWGHFIASPSNGPPRPRRRAAVSITTSARPRPMLPAGYRRYPDRDRRCGARPDPG
jgi:agmatine deiminase